MQLDLNLLTALDALLEEGSVSGAAARLYVTTPAMSRTLGRIRLVTGDEILVRTGRTMTPTPHAVAIRDEVAALVAQSRAVLSPRRELDLAKLERTFSVVAHDAAITAIGPSLLVEVQAEAPGVVLRLLAEAATDTSELARGQVDLEVSGSRPGTPSIHCETVALHPLVVALRSRHPLGRGTLSLERYASARHVIVSRRGRLRDPIDDALLTHRFRRRVVATVATSSAALDVVRDSDLVAVIAASRTTPTGIITRPLPIDLPSVPMNLLWHHRYDNDPAHRWLRDRVRQQLLATAPPQR
jgi:DNA-binding transcriptional LysR family regulator